MASIRAERRRVLRSLTVYLYLRRIEARNLDNTGRGLEAYIEAVEAVLASHTQKQPTKAH